MLNLAMVLETSARTVPDRTAIVLGAQRLSYAELDAAARRVANLLRSRGIGPGDKVALSCPNLPWFPIVYYGILKAGAVVVPLNVLLKSREIAYHLADADAKAYFCFEGGAELPLGQEGRAGFLDTPGCEHFFLMTGAPSAVSPIEGAQTLTAALADQSADFETVATEPGDTAVILYTSGTTGRPKGAELTHSNLTLNVVTCHKLFGEVDHDVHLIALPLFHSFGQVVQMNAGLASGATLVLLPRFDARSALALMQLHAVTFFTGVPTMFWALLEADASDVDLPQIAAKLRMAGSGGSALPVEIHRRFAERFGVTILEGYGLSETSPAATFSPRGEQARPGSIGRPVWGVEVDLVAEDWTPVQGRRSRRRTETGRIQPDGRTPPSGSPDGTSAERMTDGISPVAGRGRSAFAGLAAGAPPLATPAVRSRRRSVWNPSHGSRSRHPAPPLPRGAEPSGRICSAVSRSWRTAAGHAVTGGGRCCPPCSCAWPRCCPCCPSSRCGPTAWWRTPTATSTPSHRSPRTRPSRRR
jgi:acyl-CoA synthetase (AMP-forming)/AMP-acid ligase II